MFAKNLIKKEDDKIAGTEKYTKEEFYAEIKRLYETYGKADIHTFNEHATKKVNFQWYCHRFGGLRKILSELGLEFNSYNRITKEDCIRRGEELLEEYGRISKDICTSNGVSSSVIKRIFGNFQNYFKELNYDNNFHRNVKWEDLKEDVLKFINTHDYLSCLDYRREGNYSQGVIDRFGGWCKIMKELGYKPIAEKVGEEEMLRQLRALVDEYGYLSTDLIEEKCSFTFQAVEYRFGSAAQIAERLGNPNLFSHGTSSKEKEIVKILNDLIGEENYQTQKTWNWLRSDTGRNLKVDFYIPSVNTAIEYDGEQHFSYIEYFHQTPENFKRSQELDKIKDIELEKHGIKLVRIPYTQKITEELIKSIVV